MNRNDRELDVVLIDAGGSNIGSVRNALQRLGVEAILSTDAGRIRVATHAILPGVGAAAPGMQRLRDCHLVDVVRGLTQPVLGVCLGMQLLFERSEEGDTACLGLIPGEVRHFPQEASLRVPHMGWNSLRVERDSALFAGVRAEPHVYFVHSYAAPMTAHTVASAEHGSRFAAIVQHGNFHGMQFHPERSGPIGAQLLKNFLSL
ncbi:MAG: imidazole glycerol phosphate synthase subunit HisH [Rudaea sp.]|nr:imidazole glycerol phosphate synthase subunit HisH [Rudaea sp.]